MSDSVIPSGGQVAETTPSPVDESPPLTATPFALSAQYVDYVSNPSEFRYVIGDKLARLQNILPRLGSTDLRQAKADIVYLKAILDDEGENIAQVKAGATFAAGRV